MGSAVDVEKRFNEHLRDNGNSPKNRWLSELKRYGLTPGMEVLEEVQGYTLTPEREKWWIGELLRAGEPLTNTLHILEQGFFAKQQKIPHNPYTWYGTKLRGVRKGLGVTRSTMAELTNLPLAVYNRVESGSTVRYSIAQNILQTINSLLREREEPEVSLDDLGWTPKG